jgi:hypothetical protein
MEKQLRVEIVAEVKRSVEKAMEVYNEVWLTDDLLADHISLMTKRWLRDHGDMLPRTPIEWTDKKGAKHSSSYLYPLHRIQAMMNDGRIKELRQT